MAKHKNIMPRYFCLIALMAVVGISIIAKVTAKERGETWAERGANPSFVLSALGKTADRRSTW